MNGLEFARKFFRHLTGAALVLFVVLLIGEYFVPGSVLPFVDLVDFSIMLLSLLVITIFV